MKRIKPPRATIASAYTVEETDSAHWKDTPDEARVFFAIWPEEPVRTELDRLASELYRLKGGRRTRSDTIHLTLLFVGNIPRTTLSLLQAMAAEIRLPGFELVFDRTECWRHNRIACVTTSRPPLPLIDLVTGLEGTLDRLGIPYDRRPFKPHVTLLRNADCRPDDLPTPAIRWPVQEYVLVESMLSPEGARYSPLSRYPLS